MTPVSGSWQRRYLNIERERNQVAHRPEQIKTEMIRRLQQLARSGYCSPQVVGWVRHEAPKDRCVAYKVITFSENADGRAGAYPALRLAEVATIENGGLLTMAIKLEDRSGRILSYSIGIQGKARDDGRPWYARIDLHEEGDQDLRGDSRGGFCNHPLLHCHVGANVERREQPEVRSPLCWLMPWEALEWLLATVEPRLEPEPREPPRVNLEDPVSLDYWSNRLGVPPAQLRNLVNSHGPLVYGIKRALERR